MRRLALLSVVLGGLAACTTSPLKIVEHGQRHEFAAATAPKKLADCTAVNARSFSEHYTSSVRELIRPDNYQVVVSELRYGYEPIIVARTSPSPAGAQLEVFTSEHLDALHTADWLARLRQGC